ncbi:uncharacterized protein BT62DRAFT_82619 [Guyanagaster necrorhizus]|uniref:Uncharacterized protein n=1 Tax=Guyanagaster necrorhizus TaxID=856835 RepID=A0A9P8AKD9_9AGAR|nr:uncharacterized protein BT62DRAFT_82619 [Guyanagaster necrorhizus MCA 3950]KAG7439113.1 hypothetical protein BT62DRAFT_82619 [Guyanagaster necrorhizus MCA 3950]
MRTRTKIARRCTHIHVETAHSLPGTDRGRRWPSYAMSSTVYCSSSLAHLPFRQVVTYSGSLGLYCFIGMKH